MTTLPASATALLLLAAGTATEPSAPTSVAPAPVALPAPRASGSMPVEEALRRRRSARQYAPAPLALADVAQLAWAAQGVTDREDGKRTAPSAGALYPLEVHVVAARVNGLPAGAWRYRPATHDLVPERPGDLASALVAACRGQEWMEAAPAYFVITGVSARTQVKYGPRAARYVAIEAGCAAQNVALQAAAMDLGTVVVGAFDDEALARVLDLAPAERPLLVMPVGRNGVGSR